MGLFSGFLGFLENNNSRVILNSIKIKFDHKHNIFCWKQLTKEENNTPTFSDFRKIVNSIPAWKEATVCKILYLLALNRSEIVTKINPDELNRKKSDAYGRYAKVRIETWKKKDFQEKVLVSSTAVAKRSKRGKSQAIIFKHVGLPTHPVFEPWSRDLLMWIKMKGTLMIEATGQTVNNWVKYALRRWIPNVTANKLRQYRINHLITEYNFNSYEVATYAGYEYKTALGAIGIHFSQLNIPNHLRWRTYFRKLLVPITGIY